MTEFNSELPEDFDVDAITPESIIGASDAQSDPTQLGPQADPLQLMQALVDERTEDLRRVQAEYVNYKKRVDRDRSLAKQQGIKAVVMELIPVLDAITQAESIEVNSEGLNLIAVELRRVVSKFGLSQYGEVADAFDPQIHEALLQIPTPGVKELEIAEIIQPGYLLDDSVIRAARVAVASPIEE